MKKIVFTLLSFLIFIEASKAQGLEFTPTIKYDSLQAPIQYGGPSLMDKKYVIPSKFLPPVQNQGNQSSCVGFAVGYAFMSIYIAERNNWSIEDEDRTFSPAFLYQKVKSCSICTACGARIDSALSMLAKDGIVPFNLYPYKEINCTLPSPPEIHKLTFEAKKFRIVNKNVKSIAYNNFQEIKLRLAENMPVIAGIYLLPDFKNLRIKGENYIYNTNTFGIEKDPENEKHALLIIGYDDNRRAFKVMNSYGRKWANKGFCWISYDSFKNMIKQSFYVLKEEKTLLPMVTVNSNFNKSKALVSNIEFGTPKAKDGVSKAPTKIKQKDSKKTVGEKNAISKIEIKTPKMAITKKDSVLTKEINLSNFHTNEIIETFSKVDSLSKYFKVFGRKEEIKKGYNYYSFGINTTEDILQHISKVVYVYDDPSFINKYSTSKEKPNFVNSYEGWRCLDSIQAIVFFDNRPDLTLSFNGCKIVDLKNQTHSDSLIKYNSKSFDIQPVVTAQNTDKKNIYIFKIELRGIEPIKDKILSVVYNWNHKSFKSQSTEIVNNNLNFEGSYKGWGCLEELEIVINFNDGTKKILNTNMCNQLGW